MLREPKEDMDTLIRAATKEDAAFVAANVMRSVGNEAPSPLWIDTMTEICTHEDTLYSYRHSCILEVGGELAGSLTAYDGAIYAKARALTFGLFSARTGNSPVQADFETGSGEFYLDSLGLLPQFRGHGLGKLLIRDALDRAYARGFRLATLIVETDHPRLIAYYTSTGFHEASRLNFLGETYIKMAQEL